MKKRDERALIFFKWSVYAIGVTFILGEIFLRNIPIIIELLLYGKTLYAFIVFELSIMLYPIWVIALRGIWIEGKKELVKHEESTDTSGHC